MATSSQNCEYDICAWSKQGPGFPTLYICHGLFSVLQWYKVRSDCSLKQDIIIKQINIQIYY